MGPRPAKMVKRRPSEKQHECFIAQSHRETVKRQKKGDEAGGKNKKAKETTEEGKKKEKRKGNKDPQSGIQNRVMRENSSQSKHADEAAPLSWSSRALL